MRVRLSNNRDRVYEICAVTDGADPKAPADSLVELRALAPGIRWVRVMDVDSRLVRTITASDVVEVLEGERAP